MWWKQNKWRVIVPVLLLALAAFLFWYGGGAPGLQGWTVKRAETPAPGSALDARPGGADGVMTAEEKLAAAAALAGNASNAPDDGDHPAPVEPEDAEISDVAHTCTISISCATILDNMDWLDPEKVELVPEDGWILKPLQVTYYEGESVFNILQRTCKQQGIHMEFVNTPLYNTAYIEGIHNLYEFDCGQLSGWMYSVNGWFPNYGCSRYALKPGDVVEWVYTCSLGVDVGGYYAVSG